MAITINADTSNGLVMTPDTSGEIKLQAGGADIATVTSSGITMASGKTLPASALTGTSPAGTNVISAGTSVASTSGTSIDFTSIPSWVKRITVMFSGVSTNGSSDWLIQLGDAGGVETTSYLGTGSSIQSGTGETNYTAGIGIRSGSSGTIAHGAVVISQVNASSNTWVAQGVLGQSNLARTLLVGAAKSLSDTLDRIRITTVNGTDTFDAGSINILYE